MLTSHRKATAAAIVSLMGLVVLGSWIAIETPSPTIAFAQVRDRIRDARTLVFDISTVAPETEEPKPLGRALFKEPGLLRYEAEDDVRTIIIARFQEGKVLSLNPATRVAVRIDGFESLTELQGGKIPDIGGEIIAQLKQLTAGSEEPLGKRTIGEKQALGFRTKQDEETVDIWVDEMTGDPLLVDFWADSNQPKTRLSNIELNTELDDSLFSLHAPEGYTLIPASVTGLLKKTEEAIPEPGDDEADLIEGLRLYAESYRGVFPAEPHKGDFQAVVGLGRKGNYLLAINDNRKYFSGSLAEVAKKGGEIRTILDHGRAAIDRLKKSGSWKYVGKGVKLGDSESPVCWYRSKGSTTYRVVYGDLSIRDVAPEDLPEVPKDRPSKNK